jgi:hypothetical protein
LNTQTHGTAHPAKGARRRLLVTGRALTKRPTLAAALLYGVLALAMLAPGLLPGKTISTADSLYFAPPWSAVRPATLHRPANNEVGDAVVQFQPFAAYAKQRLPHVPLWNPYLMGGRPFLADDQSAVFSPFNVPAYVMPLLTSLAWSAVLKLFVAAFGAFLLARALGLRPGGALLAGLCYGFNLWLVTWLSYPHSSVWALFPWLLWATERLVRRPDLLTGGALALVVGVQFLSGHAESSFDILVAVVAFFVLRATQQMRAPQRPEHFLRNSLLTFGFGLLGGTALAALVLVPFGELLSQSADLPQRAGTAIDQHLALRGLVDVFLPDYWGRATQTPLTLFIRAQAYYAGALPLLLALGALVIRPRTERWCIALFGFIGLAVAVGIPPFLQIVTRLPVFSSGHNSRLIPWYMMAVALLAGWGLDDLGSATPRAGRRRALVVLVGIVVAAPLVIGVARDEIHHLSARALLVATGLVRAPGAQTAGAADVIHLASLLAWLVLAGAGAALIVLRLDRRLSRSGFIVAAMVLVTLDLFRAGMGYNAAVNQSDARQPVTGAIRYLQSHRGTRFEATETIPWNVIAQRYSLLQAGGYDLPIPQRYDRLWRREVDPEHPSQVGTTFSDIPLILPAVDERRLRTLRLMGVTNLLLPPDAPPLHLAGVRAAYSGSDARVYAVDGAQPRAAVVGAQLTVSGGQAALDAVTGPSFDPRTTAVTEQPIPGVPAAAAARPTADGQARITSYQPERVTVRATATRPGLLVLDDRYAPGWNATVDGRPTPVSQVDYVLRGVVLGRGSHTIIFRYQPLSWRIGWITSLLALLGIAGAITVGWRRRRRRLRLRVSLAE